MEAIHLQNKTSNPVDLASQTWQCAKTHAPGTVFENMDSVNSEKRRKDTRWTPFFTPSYKYNVRIALAWVLLAAILESLSLRRLDA